MIRIRALNEDDSGESEDEVDDDSPRRVSKEVQEEEALAHYNNALSLLADSKPAESAAVMEDVLHCEFLNPNQVEDDKIYSSLQTQLRIGCLKILSQIYAKSNYEDAERVLIEATKLEPNNVTLWNRLGLVEIKLVNYELAFRAFCEGHRCSPGHWGCIENLVTMAYVLHKMLVCLHYCAVGLKRDSSFIRGLVFRDHIYELNPDLKGICENRFAFLSLNVTTPFEETWKSKYLCEVRELINKEMQKNKTKHQETLQKRSEFLICSEHLKSFAFSELCVVVAKFHHTVKSFGTFLRPIQLVPDENQVSGFADSVPRKNSATEEEADADEISLTSTTRRSSSDEKEKDSAELLSSNKAELIEGNTENTTDVQSETEKPASTTLQENENSNQKCKKKSKKGVKWWQIEGKRRSQRVKGHRLPSPNKVSAKENRFVDKLTSIIPPSLLCPVSVCSSTTDNATPEKNKTPLKHNEEAYFGTEKEASDVKAFLAEYGKTNIMLVVIRLVQVLSEKTKLEWPSELATEYISLYYLYRSHVLRPNIFLEDNDELAFEILKSDTIVILTLLELQFDKAVNSQLNIEVIRDDIFVGEVFLVKEAIKIIQDRTLELRLNWLLGRYYLLLTNSSIVTGFDDALQYFVKLEKYLHSDSVAIRIPCKSDNIISVEEVKKKLNFINRMENVNRIQELHKLKRYDDLIEILNYSLGPNDTTNADFTNRFFLAESYFHVGKFCECVEQCIRILNFVSTGKTRDEEIVNKTMIMFENICLVRHKTGANFLPMNLIKSVVQTMLKFLIFSEKDIKNSTAGNKCPETLLTVAIPWCVLHNILYQMEFQESAMYLDDQAVPNSILLLEFAHECFSFSPSSCLFDNGKLLHYIVKELAHLKSIQGVQLEYEETKCCIEQSIFCLYGHPNKKSKSRHLNDHNTGAGIPLQWDKCAHLYEYYKPDELPEFDSVSDSINAEVVVLFQRILGVMPVDSKPSEMFENINDYLTGKVEEITERDNPTDFPQNYIDIYFLIGDHHFKSKEFTKAVEYYTWDLAVKHDRFDSWAAISLAKGEMINNRLNSCDNFTIDEIVADANTVVNCFRKALVLQPGNTTIRIEFGSFLYSMHSFCSRLLKQNADLLSMDQFALIEAKKDEFLAAAAKSFESMAKVSLTEELQLNSSHQEEEERWIHHYMLGKIMEKVDPGDADKFLAQYEIAGARLHQQGASYPSKISFYNPPELAVEALEIYYRIHSSILNYIEKHNYSCDIDRMLTKYLRRAAVSPFIKFKAVRGDGSDAKRKKEQEASDISAAMESILTGVEERLLEELRIIDEESQASTIGSSEDDSTDSSAELQLSFFPTPVISYGLSAFKEKMRDKDARGMNDTTSCNSLNTDRRNSVEQAAPPPEPDPDPVGSLVSLNPHFKELQYGQIISQCVFALQECISRFPSHHKSFYRLSYTYSVFADPKIGNKICREWLLGNGPLDKKKICGLFSDRRPNNFFNCVWRNPIDDIDRPGSFPYHMSKTVSHLLSILEKLNDHEMLVEIAIQLSKVPEADKQYLYNFEREQYSQQAFISCVSAARRFVQENKHRVQDSAMSIYNSYVKLQKANPKENVMSPVLLEVYKLYLEMKGQQADNLTVDQAVKYYQHLSWTIRMQNSAKHSSAASKLIANAMNSNGNGACGQLKDQIKNTAGVLDLAGRAFVAQSLFPTSLTNDPFIGKPAVGSYTFAKIKYLSGIANSNIGITNGVPKQGSNAFSGLLTPQNAEQPKQKRIKLMDSDISKAKRSHASTEQPSLKRRAQLPQAREPPRPTGLSKSPWTPGATETPVFYSMPPSFAASMQYNGAHSKPKIISRPSIIVTSTYTQPNVDGSSSGTRAAARTTLDENKSKVPLPPGLKKKTYTNNSSGNSMPDSATSTNARKIPQGISSVTSVPSTSHTSVTWSASPFKHQETELNLPDWSLKQFERTRDVLCGTPPAAHSQRAQPYIPMTPNYTTVVDNDSDIEIIDLTTKTPEKANRNNGDPLAISPVKEPVKPLNLNSSEIKLVSLDAVLGRARATSDYPLPLKKKRKYEEVVID